MIAATKVLSLVSDSVFSRLSQQLPKYLAPQRSSLSDLESSLSDRVVVVLDPSSLTDASYRGVLTATADGRVPVVIYCDALSPRLALRILQATRAGLAFELVLFSADDRDVLRRIVADFGRRTVPAEVLERLAPSVAQLPQPLAGRVVGLFGWGALPPSVHSLFSGLPISARSARASLRSAGMRRASRILAAARVARAYEASAARGDITIDQVAHNVGFAGSAAIHTACRLLTGRSAGAVLRDVDSSGIASLLSTSLLR